MSDAQAVAVPQNEWLKSAGFDLGFIVGIAAVALVSGFVVTVRPDLFIPVMLVDLWVLGYHHVIATYTRLAFDRESFREHSHLTLLLPFAVFFGTAGMAMGLGVASVVTLYLYWQWFHYTRQSWGISRAYQKKAGDVAIDESERFAKISFYSVPLWGILYRSWQDPDTFLFLEVWTLPVPTPVLYAVGAVAAASTLWWVWLRVKAAREGGLPVAHTLYMLSHFTVFYVGYYAIEDINAGWLVINIWHNAQYIFFVWLYNNRKYSKGIDEKAKFLSTISQSRNAWMYFGVCLLLTGVVYGALTLLQIGFGWPLAVIIVVYQAINFHHYLVDGWIWKLRRKKVAAPIVEDAA